jgi:hypothetical protein
MLNFCYVGFDIHDGTEYVDYDHVLRIFEACGLFHATPLMRGSLEDCLKYPNTFITTIPSRFVSRQEVLLRAYQPLFSSLDWGFKKKFQTTLRKVLLLNLCALSILGKPSLYCPASFTLCV